MITEARRTFRHGFVLTEQELRRIVDAASRQMQRVTTPGGCDTHFQVKFRNGTIAQLGSLEDVVSQENIGSAQIVRITIHVTGKSAPEEGEEEDGVAHSILIKFVNLEVDDDEVRSISYAIRGEERDWVFVTSSELEERISRVKCYTPRTFFPPRLGIALVPLLFITGMLVGMIRISSGPITAHQMEAQWKSGQLHDPIQAIIMMEKQNESKDNLIPHWGLYYPFAALCIICLLVFITNYLYPSYVFSWGDYAKFYDKRVAARRFVFAGILVALVISVLAGVIVNRMGWGR